MTEPTLAELLAAKVKERQTRIRNPCDRVRRELGLEPKHVAGVLFITIQTLEAIESSKDGRFPLAEYRKVADFYGKTVEELWPYKPSGKSLNGVVERIEEFGKKVDYLDDEIPCNHK